MVVMVSLSIRHCGWMLPVDIAVSFLELMHMSALPPSASMQVLFAADTEQDAFTQELAH